ncbi:hypothetical protein EVAR_58189_1 [Eumeta japonica]|uniref:Uncharacterized protein n=1 Tax=Eumeta variegata TaxID=151549 RepID=A0A4C1YUR0_EUMVA|nr:hypothetical protein EVAR_58189_1 [Eumeta japonica]
MIDYFARSVDTSAPPAPPAPPAHTHRGPQPAPVPRVWRCIRLRRCGKRASFTTDTHSVKTRRDLDGPFPTFVPTEKNQFLIRRACLDVRGLQFLKDCTITYECSRTKYPTNVMSGGATRDLRATHKYTTSRDKANG